MKRETAMSQEDRNRSPWGRSRLGGGSAALAAASITIGAIFSVGVAAIFMVFGDHDRPGLVALVFAALIMPVASASGWALLVDRSTIAGAIDKPEDSIESAWYETATSGAFGDVLAGGGIGAAVFALTPLEAPAELLLMALVVLATLDVAGRYLWLRRRAA